MKTVLGLGGNLGNREENLAMAVEELEKLPRTRLLAMSNLYETAPFDVASEQPDYLNCCVLAETRLSPEELLEQCLAIENRLGRVRTEYHGARTVDIDLLLFEGCRKDTGFTNPVQLRFFGLFLVGKCNRISPENIVLISGIKRFF